MEINRENIFDIVKGLGLYANKKLGQNFLTDPKVSEKIASLIPPSNLSILEIGPGLGSLTHFLENKGQLTLCEYDSRMVNFLKTQYEKSEIKIIQNDILREDVSSYDYIIGNLPYYITTETITKCVVQGSKCKRMVFMIQKEAFPRFSASVNEDGYSPISIYISLLGKVNKEFIVHGGSFYPDPHIDSMVFSIDINLANRTDANFEVYKFAKAMFLNKRKTILNNLTNYLKSKEKAVKILQIANILENSRPENISPEEFVLLNSLIKKEQ